jgi:hypothetical protein
MNLDPLEKPIRKLRAMWNLGRDLNSDEYEFELERRPV